MNRVLLGMTLLTLMLPSVSATADDSADGIVLAQQSGTNMRDEMRKRMTSEKYDDIHGRPGNGPAYGTEAPDFSLMPLKFYEMGIDETEITEENAGALYEPVRLSDFRGKKPVVLIFGSYT